MLCRVSRFIYHYAECRYAECRGGRASGCPLMISKSIVSNYRNKHEIKLIGTLSKA